MRSLLLLLFALFAFNTGFSQQMNPDKLLEIMQRESDTLQVNGNSYQFIVDNTMLICVFDGSANRMRIISPIVEREKIGEEELLNALVANFHSALDVKYALSDEVIWSVFIHPLRELSEEQVADAIQQVYTAARTFGGSYSSTNLVFPGNTKKNEKTLPKVLKKT